MGFRLLVALLIAGSVQCAAAEDESVFGDVRGEQAPRGNVDTAPSLTGGDLVVAPIPFSNPTIDSGLGLVSGYLFRLGDGAGTSFVGGGAFHSTNGSRGLGAGASISTPGDTWRLGAFVAGADVRYDVYGSGTQAGEGGQAVPISQSGWGATAKAQRRIGEGIYAGIKVRYLAETASLRLGQGPGGADLPGLGVDTTAGLAGPIIEIDRRDDSVYARQGWRFQGELLQSFDEPLDDFGVFDYRTAAAILDHYTPLFEEDALAIRLAGCHVDGRAPFFDLCSLGGYDGFRGYPAGQFLDRAQVSLQAEYRGRLSETLGWVAFAGAGAVGDGFSGISLEDVKPAGGFGVRYRLSPEFQLDFSADIAVGTDGAAAYVYLGQRF